MRAITNRRLAAVLAAAEEHDLVPWSGVGHRGDAGAFVAAITVRLVLATTTGAPEYLFPFLHRQRVGKPGSNDWLVHKVSFQKLPGGGYLLDVVLLRNRLSTFNPEFHSPLLRAVTCAPATVMPLPRSY